MNRIARGEHLTVPAEPLHAAVTWTAVPALPDAGALTVAALLLDARGTLRADADLVSSQHAAHPSGAVHHLGTSEGEAGLVAEWLVIDPALIEPDVTRIVVAAATKGRALGRVPGLGMAVTTATGAPVAHVAVEDGVRFDDAAGPGGIGASDELGALGGRDGRADADAGAAAVATATAAVLGEFRRYDDGGGDGWRFAAVLRGYASGLGGVVEAHRAGAGGDGAYGNGAGLGDGFADGLGDGLGGAPGAAAAYAGTYVPGPGGSPSDAGSGAGAGVPGGGAPGAEPSYGPDAGAHAPAAVDHLAAARTGSLAVEAGGPDAPGYEGRGDGVSVPVAPARVPEMPAYPPDVPGPGVPGGAAAGQEGPVPSVLGDAVLGAPVYEPGGMVPPEPVLRPPVPGPAAESPFAGAPAPEAGRLVADAPTVGLAVVGPPAREAAEAATPREERGAAEPAGERAVLGRITNRPAPPEQGAEGSAADASAQAPVREQVPEQVPGQAPAGAREQAPAQTRTNAAPASQAILITDAAPASEAVPLTDIPPTSEAVPLTDITPSPEPTPHTDLTPTFTPWERTGTGDEDVVPEGPLPDGPVLVEFASPGGPAAVEVVESVETAEGEQRTASPLLSGTGRFRGRAVFTPRAGRPPRLRVAARRQWSLTFLPLSEARVLEPDGALQGTGPDVLRYSGPAADLRVNHTGGRADRGSLTLRAVYPGGDPADRDGADVLAQGRGALIDVTPVAGPCLLLVDADGPWSLAALPSAAPEPEPADGVLAEYAGQGRNLEVVEIAHPCPGSPVILEYDLEGSDFFAVTEIDPYGDTRELISKDEGFQGRRLLFTGLTEGETATRLELGALTRWRFRLLPLSAARPLTGEAPADGVTGTGCDVLVHSGAPAALTLTSAEAGPVHVTSLEAGGLARVRVTRAHTPRPAHGPLRARPGAPTYVLVTAAGDQSWKLTLRPSEEIRSFTTAIDGHGHDVVRWTGAPGPVRFDYDFDDGEPLLDEIPRPELWALDEHLSPLYRVAAGIGVHHVPAGCLQVRAHRAWRLTVDGARQAPDAASVEGWPGTS
ncbi:TerD family protein [Streptomyces mobaraensis NBRC 13819 = DSM 40847]|uniref:Resistance protein n=1 Tax=Streptomyces mobaraensis (strain ATCC 29032 / DSM 40847 / JCM 4168 / NBRC 13819 / NCIMB 11159 / IPCR 16-22) TaxID=1223523 RepID=M3AUB8_STRM1|nr:TerD family protein [Streptomyces mobaraensis]EME97197.1 resistance protein [Streptomyces mobaraensis NBRC 13819 = DSM 40847]QTT73849.1 TerD family protein [Streptomyces mobaraensis NBRC 13819 = DSM 40847]